MPVFGADPDSETSIWEEDTHFVRRYVSKPVSALTQYFGYHPKMKMSQVFNDEDKTVLNAYFSRKLKQGVTEASLRKIVDRFWLSWGGDTDRPAYSFTSNKVQQSLMALMDVIKDDPVLEWLLDGMPSNGPFEDANEMRKVVTRHAVEGLFRYPDVVADVVRVDNGNEATLLEDLEDLILIKLGDAEAHERGVNYGFLAQRSALPKELTGAGKVRPRQETVSAAIASIPMSKKVEW